MKHAARPIGGLLIESVVGARGVKVYQPEFMRRLRALCDELQVPIIADEILTGGGRTGKFFAYQHYEGFEPDLITFGKGLQVSGIARVQRSNGARLVPYWSEMTTLKAYAEPLLKGAQVMNRIHRDKLMDNAREVGEYLVRRLQEREVGTRTDRPEARSRGFGLLIYSEAPLDYRQTGISGAQGRLMPYLTLSKAEVDQLLGTPRQHLTRLGAEITDLQRYYSDKADPKQLPKDTYWQPTLAVSLEQAQQYLDAPDSSPRLKRQAAATVAQARAAAAGLSALYARPVLASGAKDKIQQTRALSLACSLLSYPAAALPAKTRARLQRLALQAVPALIERNLAAAREDRAQQVKYETASLSALKAFTRFESYDSQYQSYISWAQALQAADPQAWKKLKGELDRLEPEVQAVLGNR